MKQINTSSGFLRSHEIYHQRYVYHNQAVHYLIHEFGHQSIHIARKLSRIIKEIV